MRRWGDKGREMGEKGKSEGKEKNGCESKVCHSLAWPALSTSLA